MSAQVCDLIHQRSTAIGTTDLLKDVSWLLTNMAIHYRIGDVEEHWASTWLQPILDHKLFRLFRTIGKTLKTKRALGTARFSDARGFV